MARMLCLLKTTPGSDGCDNTTLSNCSIDPEGSLNDGSGVVE